MIYHQTPAYDAEKIETSMRRARALRSRAFFKYVKKIAVMTGEWRLPTTQTGGQRQDLEMDVAGCHCGQ